MVVTQGAHGRSPPPLPGASPSDACLPHLRKPRKAVSPHPSPDPKARATLRQQLSCGPPRREKDKASSQCRSKAGTSATWSRQRPALAGSPRQAPGYRRLHYRLSSSRSNAGAVQQLSTGLQYPQGNFSSQQQRGVRNSPRRLPAAGAFPGSASEPCSFF